MCVHSIASCAPDRVDTPLVCIRPHFVYALVASLISNHSFTPLFSIVAKASFHVRGRRSYDVAQRLHGL